MPLKRTHDNFVTLATQIHEGRYTYEGTYTGNLVKMAIRCRVHGIFFQTPKEHLKGKGCSECGRIRVTLSRKITSDEFFARCHDVHKGKYRYPSELMGLSREIAVVCPQHGEFFQMANLHMRGGNCPKCSLTSRSLKRRADPKSFFARCREVHKDKYTYPGAFEGSLRKMRIMCPIHGEFFQKAGSHVRGSGCPACAVVDISDRVPVTQREATFVGNARKTHGDKYDYSSTGFTTYDSKVSIGCPVHGVFQQTPGNHLSYGCLKCGRERTRQSQQRSVEEFVSKARGIHGDKYDYSQVHYKSSKHKVVILCPIHGRFQQTPNSHLMGSSCDWCGGTASLTLDVFVQRAQATHGMKYSYPARDFSGLTQKVTIQCPDHGSFQQNAGNHLSGSGCPKCNAEEASARKRGSLESFLGGARRVHGDTYGYDHAAYAGSQTKLTITCPVHGDFEQRPADHVNSANGCPSCTHHYSRPHQEIEAYLASLGVDFTSSRRDVIPPFELDVYISDYDLAIEFNGTFWHSVEGTSRPHRKHLHKRKFDLCREQGIDLLQINEDEWENPEKRDIWKSLIASRVKKHKYKVSARSTQFRTLSYEHAAAFLAEHHLQGPTHQARWCFGLYYKEDLVAVITFSKHQKISLNLTRMGFASHLTVVGGAQKLFKNALKHLPDRDIVTFSDNRYSGGDIYPVLGFTKDAYLPPSYRWLYRGSLMNKRRCRHKHLPKLLGDAYDPSLTEHQNMFRAGARCLYDAGYQRWVYRRADTGQIK